MEEINSIIWKKLTQICFTEVIITLQAKTKDSKNTATCISFKTISLNHVNETNFSSKQKEMLPNEYNCILMCQIFTAISKYIQTPNMPYHTKYLLKLIKAAIT